MQNIQNAKSVIRSFEFRTFCGPLYAIQSGLSWGEGGGSVFQSSKRTKLDKAEKSIIKKVIFWSDVLDE